VVVQDTAVSRRHVELDLRAEGVAVRDLGSRNGTFYLGQRVEKMMVSLGSQLTVGRTTLAIDADTDALEESLNADLTEYGGILGETVPMRRLFALLGRLEGSLVPVLLEGESGVGKELFARALHDHSQVSSGAFVAVNCGAISQELVASELFGHKKGAFTGAHEQRKGAFESADGGTLFLDEIGELPLDVQPSLLRAVETGEIRAVGADAERRVRVRIVAATNRDLPSEVASGRFREDLFYRLAVVKLVVPPLRERSADIPLLARRFAAQTNLPELPDHVVEQLRARHWPGNVRELKNAIQGYAALGILTDVTSSRTGADRLDVALSEFSDTRRTYADQKDTLVDRFTEIYLRQLMADAKGNQSEAARMADLDRAYLRKLLAKYGLIDK